VDKYGIPLLDCDRGTNITENVHKQIIATYGSWHVGVQMVRVLRACMLGACDSDLFASSMHRCM
jgi:hypothetical protein